MCTVRMWGERQPLLAEHLEVLEQWLGHGSNDTLALALLMHTQGCRVAFGMSHGLRRKHQKRCPLQKRHKNVQQSFKARAAGLNFEPVQIEDQH